MIDAGPHNVVVNPNSEPQALKQTIEVARMNWAYNTQRISSYLAAEPPPVNPDYLRQLSLKHNKLLWENIPRALLRNFAAIDKNIQETSHVVGNYQLVKAFDTMQGTVLQALNQKNQICCAIKVFEKSDIYTCNELEGIYREYCFLALKLEHPNIVKCLHMMHTET